MNATTSNVVSTSASDAQKEVRDLISAYVSGDSQIEKWENQIATKKEERQAKLIGLAIKYQDPAFFRQAVSNAENSIKASKGKEWKLPSTWNNDKGVVLKTLVARAAAGKKITDKDTIKDMRKVLRAESAGQKEASSMTVDVVTKVDVDLYNAIKQYALDLHRIATVDRDKAIQIAQENNAKIEEFLESVLPSEPVKDKKEGIAA